MNRLEGLHRADAVILGGGLTALLTAAALTEDGMQVIGVGVSAENIPPIQTGTILQGATFARIAAVHGLTAAARYAHALQDHLQLLLSRPLPYVQTMPVYAYARLPQELPLLEKQHALLRELQLPVAAAPDAGGCPFPVELSLTADAQAWIDMVKWCEALQADIRRKGGRLYAASPIRSMELHRICTVHGCAEAAHVILIGDRPAGHRARRLLALLESRLLTCSSLTSAYPLHSCQLPVAEDGLSLLPTSTGAIVLGDAGQLGIRDQNDRLSRFGQSLQYRLPDWTPGPTAYAAISLPSDGLPLIGTLPGSGLLCAAGCDHSPLAAMHSAAVLVRRIRGRMQPEDALYAPDRRLPAHVMRRQMQQISILQLRNLLRSGPACSLCGCHMRYIADPQWWVCPVCGSVFSMLGQIIGGPAVQPAQVSVLQRPDL